MVLSKAFEGEKVCLGYGWTQHGTWLRALYVRQHHVIWFRGWDCSSRGHRQITITRFMWASYGQVAQFWGAEHGCGLSFHFQFRSMKSFHVWTPNLSLWGWCWGNWKMERTWVFELMSRKLPKAYSPGLCSKFQVSKMLGFLSLISVSVALLA